MQQFILNGVNVEKSSVALIPEMAIFIRDVLESGEYASSSEVLREVLRDWKLKCLLQLQNIDELRGDRTSSHEGWLGSGEVPQSQSISSSLRKLAQRQSQRNGNIDDGNESIH